MKQPKDYCYARRVEGTTGQWEVVVNLSTVHRVFRTSIQSEAEEAAVRIRLAMVQYGVERVKGQAK